MRPSPGRIGLFFGFVLCGGLAMQACGGRTDADVGDGGPGSSGSSGGSSSSSSSGGSSSSSSGGPPPPPLCPPEPPGPGATCEDGLTCSYGEGCDSEECFCTGGYWECEGTSCPPSSCPPAPPGNDTACVGIGSVCDYPIENNVCSTWECDCYPSGIYDCYETDCFGADAGVGNSSGGASSSSSGGFGQ
jgi:hypothetical protein